MSNIILQHFDGDLRPLDELSVENMTAYAAMIGADYRLIRGKPFNARLTGACQKVYMIDEEFDEYDNVCMVDIDMFAPRGMKEDVFKVKGVGLHAETQDMLHRKIINEYGISMTDINKPYWGGAIYKMDRGLRQRLRETLRRGDDMWMNKYNQAYHFEDEGIFHTLMCWSSAYLRKDEWYMDRKWCQCSFLPNPEKAGFIHVRTKVTPQGPKRTKMENYQALVNKGIL